MGEASWLINNFDGSNSMEGGFYSGYFVYDNSFTNTSVYPYFTVANGTSGARDPNNPLYSGVYMDVVPGSPGHVSVGTTTFINLYYTVSNGRNAGQDEVVGTTGTWMGNGSGNGHVAYWSPDGVNWYLWGSHNDCANTPYWISSGGAYVYNTGGY
jgi:hypothetical protein